MRYFQWGACVTGIALMQTLSVAHATASNETCVRLPSSLDRNVLRNGSFEFANRYNGMRTVIDQGDVLTHTWGVGMKRTWCDLGLEQWWGEGPTNRALFAVVDEAFSGTKALRVTAPGVATTWLAYPSAGGHSPKWMLSWRMCGSADAAVTVEVSLYEGIAALGAEYRLCARSAKKTGIGRDWTLETFAVDFSDRIAQCKKPAFQVRFVTHSGSVTLDDVQLERGEQVTAFATPRSHFLSLSMDRFEAKELPKFRKNETKKTRLDVRNTSGHALAGRLSLWLDHWDAPGRTPLATRDCGAWPADAVQSFDVDLGGLSPDGYVVLAALDPLVSTQGVFTAENTGWGYVGKSMLLKRNGLRFAVFPPEKPRELFGVGNGMIGHDGWWSGNTIPNAVRGRSIHPVLLGEADPFKAAIIGAPNIRECPLPGAGPKDLPDACNPTSPSMIHPYSPNGRKVLKERARAFGQEVGHDPSVAGAKLDNEGFFVNRGNFCPDKWADFDFRQWLQKRYGGQLSRLNAAWKTEFAQWDDVVQPISGLKNGTIDKTGGAALDWMASMGKMTPAAQERLKAKPAWALDWFRWRAYSVIKIYDDFIREAQTADKKTLYGNNYPWPNYFTHIIWPQWRTHGVIMLDQQYVCGFPKTLGTNEEMIDILEQAESVARDERPIWGREIYFQPNYPGEMAALQNWAMIAHGMAVPMTFAWRPYADYKREIFKTGTKSWLKDGAPPMWFIIDTDGSGVPGYAPNARSTDEIAAFHRRYNGHSLKRIPGEVALYFSTDTSNYIMYETFDKPYASSISQRRMSVAAALRHAGSRIEYFDDETLNEVNPKRYPILVAPGEKVLPERIVAMLKRYAANGGRLLVFEDFNTLDENLNEKTSPGAGGWTGDVRLIRDFETKYAASAYNTEGHERSVARLLETGGFPRHAWWENETPRQDGEEKLLAGEGRPVVEVVVRKQLKTHRRFAFVLNKGGAGRGCLCGDDFDGVTLRDALTGTSVDRAFELPAFGYRVLVLEPKR